jgi:hypothetical protein
MKHSYFFCGYRKLFSLCFTLLLFWNTKAQIWQPEGLNAPGDWNGWANPPAANSPFGSEFQVSNGGVKKLTQGVIRWQSTFQASSTGTFGFLFTSGGGNPWGNKWADVNVAFNTYQSYNYQGGANNSISLTNGRHYTFNWRDAGYANTHAVFMETDNAPVNISSISQSPLASNVTPADPVVVTVNTSASLSSQEKVYIRYSTNSFTSSTLVEANMTGNSGTATIPAQPDGTSIQYYAFTSTASVAQIGSNYDMFTIKSGSTQSYTSTASSLVSVTFQVDMANEAVSVNGVHVAGSFNGFNPSATPLTLVSGTTYAATVLLAQNSTIQYKFINGNNWGSDESVPSACNVGGNREFTVGTGNVDIPLHCYASCVTCVPKVPVKFSVNMSGLTISGNGVHVAGNFGSALPNWNPSGIQLTHEGSGIYSTTLMLIPGTYVQYKFLNGNNWGTDEGVPGACNVSGNREILVPGSAYNVPVNCFGTCSNCVSVTFRVNMSGQTVSGNGVHVAGSFQGWNPGGTALSPVGDGVYEVTVKMDPNTSFQYKFVNGNSWGSDEGVPGLCNSGGNRTNSVGTSNKVINVVCYRRCIDCNAPSQWIGTSSNFNDGNNWSAGVAPNSCNFNLNIPNTANQPNLSSGTFSANNVSFQTGASLNLGSGATFNVCGNLNAGSSQISGQGTLALTGTSAQTISGNIIAENLTINNPNGVSLASGASVGVKGALKLQSGAFNVSSGSFSLLAGFGFEGRILKIESGASFVGNLVAQKYLNGLSSTAAGGWYFLGAPVSGIKLNDFAQGGNEFHPSTFIPGDVAPGSLYQYSQNAGSSFDDFGWTKASNPNSILSTGTGVRVWVKKDISYGIMSFGGSLISGPQNFTLNYCGAGCSYSGGGSTNGWNLLANPYPCPINWNNGIGWTKSGIDQNAIYIWNAATGQYAAYDGVTGTNGGSPNIASGQAFFVEAQNGSASLSVNEDAKANVYTSGLRTNVSQPSGMRISASLNGRTEDAWLDISAERLFVAVKKLNGLGMNLGLGQNQKYCIAGLNTVANDNIIPVSIANAQGLVNVSFEMVGEEWAAYQVFLKDNVAGEIYSLQNGSNLSLMVSASDEDRFSLILQPEGVTSTKDILKSKGMVWPNPAVDRLNFSADAADQEVIIYSLAGKPVQNGFISADQSSLTISSLPVGTYLVKLKGSGKTFRFSKQ